MQEIDIRPKKIFDEYLRLAAIDAKKYFSEAETIEIYCPACGTKGEFDFVKDGFHYNTCPTCSTLYVSPRPLDKHFAKYYKESPSSEYWATTFYRKTEQARREKLWKPKSDIVKKKVNEYMKNTPTIVDIGGGYGIFAEEISKILTTKVIIIEPGPLLANECREKGFLVVEKFLDEVKINDLPSGNKVFVSFELFEHLFDPYKFLLNLSLLMSSGDVLILTTLSSLGIDIQSLWENSKSVSPPHHINFFNPVSVEIIFKRCGLRILEITTPGQLDIDILSKSQEYVRKGFIASFLKHADEEQKASLQRWVSSNNMSSHMWVIARKP